MTQEIIAPARPMRVTQIKDLVPSLPERGKIKIGIKGAVRKSSKGNEFQPPEKLDHFVVTGLERDQTGNFRRDEAIHKTLGEKPTEISVRLLYDDPALNFPTRYACFRGKTLWCSGDGERANRLGKDGQYHEGPCPCPRKDPGHTGPDKCKMNGVLSAMIDGAGSLGGVWKFRTTSYNSIVNILSSMAFLRSLTGGALANIPLQLRVSPKPATKPDGSPVTIYMVSLEFNGDMDALQQRAIERSKTMLNIAQIESEARRMLALAPPSVPLAGDVASDVVEEFYPEQAMIEAEPETVSGDLDAFASGAPAREPPPAGKETPKPDAARQRPPESPAATLDEVFIATAEDAARHGLAAYEMWFKSLSKNNRQAIAPHHERLKEMAAEADRDTGTEFVDEDNFPGMTDRGGARLTPLDAGN